VLAEVAAKRRALAGYDGARGGLNAAVDRHLASGSVEHGVEVARVRLPIRDAYELPVKFAALPYADHPNYREAWRP
jgi:hypothetical protein